MSEDSAEPPQISSLAGVDPLLDIVFESAPIALGILDRDFRFVRVNARLAEMNGIPGDAHTGKRPDEILPDVSNYKIVHARWAEFLETGKSWLGVEITGSSPGKPDLSRIWTEDFFPLRTNGSTVAVGVVVEETNAALGECDARFRIVKKAVYDPVAQVDMAGKIIDCNDLFCIMLGYSRDELISKKTYFDLTPLQWHPVEAEIVHEQVLKRGYSDLYEKEYRRADGVVFPVELRTILSRNAMGQPASMWAIVRDISPRRQREKQIQLLMREVNHRAKNILGLVQVIARQTLAASTTDFVERFSNRVQSLADSQDLLIKNSWCGVDLEQLVRTQLAYFQDFLDTRITISGRPVMLSAASSQTIGMVIHELATNASKYGALSNCEGRVRIAWAIRETDDGASEFVFSWKEEGGPPARPPARVGFGSTVIGDMVKYSLSAGVKVEYNELGFGWVLTCPLTKIVDDASRSDSQIASKKPPSSKQV